jgi:hypothetical protein
MIPPSNSLTEVNLRGEICDLRRRELNLFGGQLEI